MNYTLVLVLYEQNLLESKTYQSLQRFLSEYRKQHVVNLLIYDNSINFLNEIDETKNEGFTYIKNEGNIGLAQCYNDALKKAILVDSEWLVLLDQDTELTKDYFDALFQLSIPENKDIVAIVPQMISQEKIISPILGEGLPKLQEKLMVPGVYQNLMAINSASILSVNFLKELKGFNEEFSLDYLDHWLYFEINQRKKDIQVLNVVIQHELSVMNYNTISIGRYESILNSETNFYLNYSLISKKAYKKRLILRFFKQLLMVKNKEIARYTLKKYQEIK